MSAFEEMRGDGQMGEATLQLFVWNVSSTVRRHGYPPPPGHSLWTHAACLEWTLELFYKKGHELATRLYALATDEKSFTRLIVRTIENEFKDQAKATTVGKLRSRLRTILADEPDFIDATELFAGHAAWTLASFGDAIFSGDWEDLLYAPELKAIEPISVLNTAGPTSRENVAKLVSAARIILEHAGGAMRDQVLARALVKLFELETSEVFFGANAYLADHGQSVSPELWAEAVERGDQIILSLSTDEAHALLVLDEPLSIGAAYLPHVVDLGEFMQDLRAKLRGLIGDEPLPIGTLDHVLDWARRLPMK